jgi:hypothetical protein
VKYVIVFAGIKNSFWPIAVVVLFDLISMDVALLLLLNVITIVLFYISCMVSMVN